MIFSAVQLQTRVMKLNRKKVEIVEVHYNATVTMSIGGCLLTLSVVSFSPCRALGIHSVVRAPPIFNVRRVLLKDQLCSTAKSYATVDSFNFYFNSLALSYTSSVE